MRESSARTSKYSGRGSEMKTPTADPKIKDDDLDFEDLSLIIQQDDILDLPQVGFCNVKI